VIVETTGLVKRYGQTVALDDIDLAVPEGAIYGLVGPNGAGKTTLLGILTGLRTATEGTVRVGVGRTRIGVLPDTPRFEPWLTGREVVDLARALTAPDLGADRVAEVLAEAGLTDAADRAVGGYSRGMLQRLGMASTVVGRPDLLFLDEPSSALDPAGRREVLDLVARLRGRATVVFSSHILSDVQEVCDTVGILREGRLLYQGDLHGLLVGSAVPAYRVRLRPPVPDAVVAALRARPWVTGVEVGDGGEVRVGITAVEDAERGLAAALAGTGAAVVSVGPEAASLEQVFLELTR
jgi:ABC-2 type transport system ATP-binding protein